MNVFKKDVIERVLKLHNKKYVRPSKEATNIKIILGKINYLQKLGNTELRVKRSSYGNIMKTEYSKFNTIALLVNDWVKVQTSLEMVFNMLFGTDNTISIINEFKKKKISPTMIAIYLRYYHGILLLNRYDKPHNRKRKDNLSELRKIKNVSHVLILGKGHTKSRINSRNVVRSAYCIHPSGVNLNSKSTQEFYDVWYQQMNHRITPLKSTVTFNDFKII